MEDRETIEHRLYTMYKTMIDEAAMLKGLDAEYISQAKPKHAAMMSFASEVIKGMAIKFKKEFDCEIGELVESDMAGNK